MFTILEELREVDQNWIDEHCSADWIVLAEAAAKEIAKLRAVVETARAVAKVSRWIPAEKCITGIEEGTGNRLVSALIALDAEQS